MVLFFAACIAVSGVGHAPERTVIIGDSQAEGLRSVGILPRAGVDIFAFPGEGAAFFLRWLDTHPSAVMHRDLVVFQLGGNDVSQGESAEHIQETMLALAKLSRTFNPHAQVVFGAIPVRGQWFDAQKRKHRPLIAEREQTLEAVNAWIALGDHMEFSSFHLNAIIADPDAPRLQRVEYKRRGADVHLNKRGYSALSRALIGSLIAN